MAFSLQNVLRFLKKASGEMWMQHCNMCFTMLRLNLESSFFVWGGWCVFALKIGPPCSGQKIRRLKSPLSYLSAMYIGVVGKVACTHGRFLPPRVRWKDRSLLGRVVRFCPLLCVRVVGRDVGNDQKAAYFPFLEVVQCDL